jgi:hypothetical protein
MTQQYLGEPPLSARNRTFVLFASFGLTNLCAEEFSFYLSEFQIFLNQVAEFCRLNVGEKEQNGH